MLASDFVKLSSYLKLARQEGVQQPDQLQHPTRLPQSWVKLMARQLQGYSQQSTHSWPCSPFMHMHAAKQTMNLADLSRPCPVEALLLGPAQCGRQGLLLLLLLQGAPHRGRVQGASKSHVGWRSLPGRRRSAWLPCAWRQTDVSVGPRRGGWLCKLMSVQAYAVAAYLSQGAEPSLLPVSWIPCACFQAVLPQDR